MERLRHCTAVRLWLTGAMAGLVGLLAFSMLPQAQAFASAGTPSVAWRLPSTATAGQTIPFTWNGRHLGRGHRVVIQKPEGTAHTWRSIMSLSGNRGSAELRALPLGRYRLRIADLRGRRVLAQQVAGVAVFGEVPFSALFPGKGGVYTTPTNSFPYVASWRNDRQPAFQVEHNHCRFVHIAFVSAPDHIAFFSGSHEGVSKVTIVQESREPTSATSPFEAIGGLDVELVPSQTWAMNISIETVEPEEEPYDTYINGYAICDSTEPLNS